MSLIVTDYKDININWDLSTSLAYLGRVSKSEYDAIALNGGEAGELSESLITIPWTQEKRLQSSIFLAPK